MAKAAKAAKAKRSPQVEDYADQLSHYEKLLNQYVNEWVPILGLDSWVKISVSCVPSANTENISILGQTSVQWEYMEAHIEFFLGGLIMVDLADERLEYLVLHELCHCIVNEMRDESSDKAYIEQNIIPHEERVVCNLAKSFLRLKYR